PVSTDEGATRLRPRVEAEPGRGPLSRTDVILRAPDVHSTLKRGRSASRFVSVPLLLLPFFVIGHELAIASRAERLKANVPAAELDGIGGMWNRYHLLGARSLRLTTSSLEEALTRRTITLGDSIIGNYRLPVPTLRETQWKMARGGFKQALAANPDDAELEGALRYCEGHLHRINGEARKTHQQNAEAQHEFTDAVAAFREAAELRSDWPDPFLGLMRTFIYGLEDVDRGADALERAQRLGFTPGDRETVQLADGYRARGDTFIRTARTLTGMAQEQEYLTRAAEAYREAIE